MTYDFGYADGTPYEHAVRLLERHAAPGGGVVVDLGCGYGAIAEPVGDLSLQYLGADLDPGGVKSLRDRGFEAVVGDLGRPQELLAEVKEALGGRRVAAICMLDVVEHMAQADAVLEAVQAFAVEAGDAPLVVSIPNVTHLDMGVKLLMGRWDVTRTGLLDMTHLRFFSPGELGRAMQRTGWREIGRHDLELSFSDQHFPRDLVPLERETPVGAFLMSLRRMADDAGLVNQFVRAYAPSVPEPVAVVRESEDGPFMSVLVRTQGTRPVTLHETLLSLAAQTCDDFEVLVLAHDVGADTTARLEALVGEFHPAFAGRVRIVPVEGGGRARPLNVGARAAHGRYLAMLDDDDVALAHWIAELRAAEARKPGGVLRIGVATQEVAGGTRDWSGEEGYRVVNKPRCRFPLEWDFLGHFFENWTPNCGYAVPRSMVVDLRHFWDEDLPVLEDWDHLLRTAAIAGVESAPTYATLVRMWTNAENSLTVHSTEEWRSTRQRVIARLDAQPFLLDRGSASKVRAVFQQTHILELELTAAHQQLALVHGQLATLQNHLESIHRSRSWRVARVLSRGGRPARAVLGPLGVLRAVRWWRRRRAVPPAG